MMISITFDIYIFFKGKWVLNEYEKIKQICGTKITSQRGFINYNPKNNGFKRKIRLFVNTFNDINFLQFKVNS